MGGYAVRRRWTSPVSIGGASQLKGRCASVFLGVGSSYCLVDKGSVVASRELYLEAGATPTCTRGLYSASLVPRPALFCQVYTRCTVFQREQDEGIVRHPSLPTPSGLTESNRSRRLDQSHIGQKKAKRKPLPHRERARPLCTEFGISSPFHRRGLVGCNVERKMSPRPAGPSSPGRCLSTMLQPFADPR